MHSCGTNIVLNPFNGHLGTKGFSGREALAALTARRGGGWLVVPLRRSTDLPGPGQQPLQQQYCRLPSVKMQLKYCRAEAGTAESGGLVAVPPYFAGQGC